MNTDQNSPDVVSGTQAGSISTLPQRPSPPAVKTGMDKDKKPTSPIITALDELDNAIASLDNQLANFYDDINSVLTPESSGEKGGSPSDPSPPRSEITEMINNKRNRINRISEHLHETRNRIEL